MEILTDNDYAKTLKIKGHKYIALKNGSSYKVQLRNDRSTRCDALLSIDGEVMGKWRIPAYGKITLERPTKKNKKFTFVEEGTIDAVMGGIESGGQSNGLVTVTFFPETKRYDAEVLSYNGGRKESYRMTRSKELSRGMPRGAFSANSTKTNTNVNGNSNLQAMAFSSFAPDSSLGSTSGSGLNGSNGYASGGTVLKGKSDQVFRDTSAIYNIDRRNVTKLAVRLVVSKKKKKQQNPPRIDKLAFADYDYDDYDYGDDNERDYDEVEPKKKGGFWSGVPIIGSLLNGNNSTKQPSPPPPPQPFFGSNRNNLVR